MATVKLSSMDNVVIRNDNADTVVMIIATEDGEGFECIVEWPAAHAEAVLEAIKPHAPLCNLESRHARFRLPVSDPMGAITRVEAIFDNVGEMLTWNWWYEIGTKLVAIFSRPDNARLITIDLWEGSFNPPYEQLAEQFIALLQASGQCEPAPATISVNPHGQIELTLTTAAMKHYADHYKEFMQALATLM